MKIIDSHLHAVAADVTKYPLGNTQLPGNSWVTSCPVTTEGLLQAMDSAGVAGGILVQPVGAYGTDNTYVADSAQNHTNRLGAVCVIDMVSSERLGNLNYWIQKRGMGGLRIFSVPTPRVPWLDNPATFEIWEACEAWGVRVSVCLLPAELPRLRTMLQHFPRVDVALDHCGFVYSSELASDASSDAATGLLDLADCPNLILKVTTNVLDTAGDDALSELARHFGADRLMWGSDFPQTHDRPYAQLVDHARQASAELSPTEQEQFLGGTALRLWPELQ